MKRFLELIKRHWVVLIVVAAAIYLLAIAMGWVKNIFGGIGRLFGGYGVSSEDVEKELNATNIQPTKPELYWKSIAETIYDTIGRQWQWEDTAKVVKLMREVMNDTDYLMLYKAFGNRWEKLIILPVNEEMNLQSFLNNDLSDKEITEINQDYASKGIKYRI